MPSRMLRLVLAADAAILSCCLALFSAATACALSTNCLSALVTLVLAVVSALFVSVSSLDIDATNALAVVSL
jgi:hypothetical protein